MLLENDVFDESAFAHELDNYGLAINSEEIEILLGLDRGRLRKRSAENNIFS